MDYTPEKAVREAMEEAEAKKADKPEGRMMPPMEIEGKPPKVMPAMEIEGKAPEVKPAMEIKGDPDAELEPDKDAERLKAELDDNEMVQGVRRGDWEPSADEMEDIQKDLGIDPQADREEQVKQAVEWLYDNDASNKDMQLMFSALSLYNNGRATWDSVLEAALAAQADKKDPAGGEYKGPQAAPEA